MKLISPKFFTQKKNYRAGRMSLLRGEVNRWMCEYESANTEVHRNVCLDMINRNLRKYEWYGHR